MKRYTRRTLIVGTCVISLAGIGYWYADRLGWFDNFGPDNLPTAAERQRMREIDETSSQIAPNAVPGAGVRPQGSLPPAPIETVPVPETATSSPEEIPEVSEVTSETSTRETPDNDTLIEEEIRETDI